MMQTSIGGGPFPKSHPKSHPWNIGTLCVSVSLVTYLWISAIHISHIATPCRKELSTLRCQQNHQNLCLWKPLPWSGDNSRHHPDDHAKRKTQKKRQIPRTSSGDHLAPSTRFFCPFYRVLATAGPASRDYWQCPHNVPRFAVRQSESHQKPLHPLSNQHQEAEIRSLRGRRQSGKSNRQPCEYSLKGTRTELPCEYWHPPECQFQKSESGCKFGAECSFPSWNVEEQPNKRLKKGGFTWAALRQANIRESEGPSLGKIQVKVPHQRSPYALKIRG